MSCVMLNLLHTKTESSNRDGASHHVFSACKPGIVLTLKSKPQKLEIRNPPGKGSASTKSSFAATNQLCHRRKYLFFFVMNHLYVETPW